MSENKLPWFLSNAALGALWGANAGMTVSILSGPDWLIAFAAFCAGLYWSGR